MIPMYMTTEEFLEGVMLAAKEAGYDWLNTGEHHPEDIAVNLVPIIMAYALGASAVIHKQARAQRGDQ